MTRSESHRVSEHLVTFGWLGRTGRIVACLGLLALGVFIPVTNAAAATIKVEWTGEVTSAGIEGLPLLGDAAALVRVGDRASYQLILEQLPPDEEDADPFEQFAVFRSAIQSYSVVLGAFSAVGDDGRVLSRRSLGRFDQGVDTRANVAHNQILPPDHPLAGVEMSFFIDRGAVSDDTRDFSVGLEPAIELLQPKPGEPAPLFMGLVRSGDDGGESIDIVATLDNGSITVVPLPPALACLIPAIALLFGFRRRSTAMGGRPVLARTTT